jgi:hypothetical protein
MIARSSVIKTAKMIWDSTLWDYAGLIVLVTFAVFHLQRLHWIWVCGILVILLLVRSWMRLAYSLPK